MQIPQNYHSVANWIENSFNADPTKLSFSYKLDCK